MEKHSRLLNNCQLSAHKSPRSYTDCFFGHKGVLLKWTFLCNLFTILRKSVILKKKLEIAHKQNPFSLFLLQDNVPSHKVWLVLIAANGFNTEILPHPSYTQNFASLLFFAFPKLKKKALRK